MEIAEEKEKEEVWSWGAGTDGQLATGELEDQYLPQLLPFFSGQPISSFSCGGAHVIALLPSGNVLSWGRGSSGQLGHGDLLNCSFPKPVQFLQDFVVINVSTGWNHSGFVSDKGCLFTCGDGSFGQLGHGDLKTHFTPTKVVYFASRHVNKIAFGMRHSLALLEGRSGDQVYGFGSGRRGQLGIPTDTIKSVSTPQRASGLENIKVVCISANGDHSASLSADGHMYIWGRGFAGTSDVYRPQCATSSLSLAQVVLGWHHALVLTDDGKVYMFGGKRHGVLSEPQKTSMSHNKSRSAEESNEILMEQVTGLDGIKVIQVAAGAEHSAVVTDDNAIMTWGWGEHGQLGLGSTSDQTIPQYVRLDLRNPVRSCRIYCGSGFTFAVRTPGHLCGVDVANVTSSD